MMTRHTFFFFKQKTAYELRISDWSSDVCSSDLLADIQFFTGPGSVQPDENVLLNKDTTGMTVFGDTNQSGLSVTFEGMEDLTLPAAGQARIEAVDGGFQWLNFHMTDPLLAFGEVEFNIDASADGTSSEARRVRTGGVRTW